MKSASLTASGSGQQRQKRAIPDDESGMASRGHSGDRRGVPCTTISEASIRRRIAVKSEPVAVTAQEAVDGRREKSDEVREC